MLIMIPGLAADYWAICLGGNWILTAPRWFGQISRGEAGGIGSFHKNAPSSTSILHCSPNTWLEKGATLERRISSQLSLDDKCGTARDKQQYRHSAGHQSTGLVWIPLISQGCNQYSQHKPYQSPYNPVPHMHLLQYCQRRWNTPVVRGNHNLRMKPRPAGLQQFR